PGTVIAAINIGGGAYEGSDGTSWAADNTGEGNVYVRTDAVDILGTDDDPLYHSEAWGRRGLDYDFDVSDGTCKVELHFAEIWSKAKTAGKRVFDVDVEGASVIDNLDVYAESGSRGAAYDVVVRGVEVRDGQLDIDFSSDVNNAFLAGLVVTSAAGAGLADDDVPDLITSWSAYADGDGL
ncbi:MAG: malectin domain-containing carbohydrate-binding protein, partial [Pseudomonadota bacterium]